MNDQTFSLHLTDPELVEQIKQVAKINGAKDWRKFARQTAIRQIKQFFGMGVDLTTKEAAQELKCHPVSILRYIDQGKLPGTYWVSQRKPMIPYAAIEAMKARTV
jgi:hypothetical protein